MEFEIEYWKIVLKFLRNSSARESIEYVVGHNYDMGLNGLWYLAKNYSTEKGIVANIFWQLAVSFQDELNYKDEKALALHIAENFNSYRKGEFGSTIDDELKNYLNNMNHEFPKELMTNISGELISYPMHTFEGLPEKTNNEIIKLQKSITRRTIP